MSWAGRLLYSWSSFWRKIEGPELEAPVWHSHYLTSLYTETVLPSLGNQLSGIVVDVGAGTGYGRKFVNAEATHYIPTDLPTGRDATNSGIDRGGVRPAFYCSCYKLPFRDETIDSIILLSVLEHLLYPQKALQEAFRVLHKEGRVLISTPFAFPVHGAPFDFRRWTPDGLVVELQQTGFSVERVVLLGGTFPALILNTWFWLRYDLGQGASAVMRHALACAMPLLLVVQAIGNAMAVLLDRLDKKRAFPLAVAVLAMKPSQDHH